MPRELPQVLDEGGGGETSDRLAGYATRVLENLRLRIVVADDRGRGRPARLEPKWISLAEVTGRQRGR